jgi:hypothetical protein
MKIARRVEYPMILYNSNVFFVLIAKPSFSHRTKVKDEIPLPLEGKKSEDKRGQNGIKCRKKLLYKRVLDLNLASINGSALSSC